MSEAPVSDKTAVPNAALTAASGATAGAPGPLGDFLARVRTRLLPAAPAYSPDALVRINGDHALTKDTEGAVILPVPQSPPRNAAVLVPVVARPEPTVLFTLRATTLSHHAGQISFPGGRVDPGDRDETAAALREADEEVGLAARHITPLGFLDGYLSGTGFWIAPLVALIDPAFEMTLNAAEVQEAFEVPLAFLMSPANHQRMSRERDGVRRTFYAMPYGERFIWGATAGMLRNFYERVYA